MSTTKRFKVLIPELIADGVSREHSAKLTQLFYHFAHKFSDTNRGRDLAHAFMNHWHEAFKKSGHWIDEVRP
jgi:hypothetical protein